jgi:RNA polymerase sigma-70 factor (ECF subfamily)
VTARDEALIARSEPPAAARSRAAASGDATPFESAARLHYAPLVRRLIVVLGSQHEAEDIAQDTYLRAFRSWARFDGVDVRAWLHTIALRLAFNRLRRRRRWLGVLSRSTPDAWQDHSDPDLWIALRRLDDRTRAALLLNVLDGYTQREIAAMFDVAEGTVSSWLTRGRAALRADLGGDPGT